MKTYILTESEKKSCLDRVADILQERPELDFAYAYGSFVEGEHFRDLDIGLFLKPDSMPERVYRYEADLESHLSKALQKSFPIDVRVLNNASIPFLAGVIKGRLLVDNRPFRRIDFVTHVIARYLDIEPMLRHYTKEAFADEIQP